MEVVYATFDEDRLQVRCGSMPKVMAALRNTAMGPIGSRANRAQSEEAAA